MKVGPVQPLVLLLLAAVAVASTIQLASPPTLVKQPPREIRYTVSVSNDESEDRPFVLECEAVGNPEPSYKWTKNGREFDPTHSDDRITQQPGRGSLVFTQPSDEDEGMYQCEATNPHGTFVSTTSWVRKVETGESADGPPKVVRATEGASLSL
ncbi:neuroglian-like [Amblyomma americanum]